MDNNNNNNNKVKNSFSNYEINDNLLFNKAPPVKREWKPKNKQFNIDDIFDDDQIDRLSSSPSPQTTPSAPSIGSAPIISDFASFDEYLNALVSFNSESNPNSITTNNNNNKATFDQRKNNNKMSSNRSEIPITNQPSPSTIINTDVITDVITNINKSTTQSSGTLGRDELTSLTVKEIKEILRSKGLPLTGNKPDLIDRIINAN